MSRERLLFGCLASACLFVLAAEATAQVGARRSLPEPVHGHDGGGAHRLQPVYRHRGPD